MLAALERAGNFEAVVLVTKDIACGGQQETPVGGMLVYYFLAQGVGFASTVQSPETA